VAARPRNGLPPTADPSPSWAAGLLWGRCVPQRDPAARSATARKPEAYPHCGGGPILTTRSAPRLRPSLHPVGPGTGPRELPEAGERNTNEWPRAPERAARDEPPRPQKMAKFFLFLILLLLCWPLALAALLLYPIVWLLLLPFRLVGVAVGGALDLIAAIIRLPARLIRAL
jgi:hypothetical protein